MQSIFWKINNDLQKIQISLYTLLKFGWKTIVAKNTLENGLRHDLSCHSELPVHQVHQSQVQLTEVDGSWLGFMLRN